MSEWDFRWQESSNPPRRPVPGRWRRPRPQGLADCFPGNISAVAGGDPGADLPWQGDVRRGDSAAFGYQADDVDLARGAADLAAFGIGEQAPRMRRRAPDDTFPLPPWPRPTAADAPAAPVGSDDGREEHS